MLTSGTARQAAKRFAQAFEEARVPPAYGARSAPAAPATESELATPAREVRFAQRFVNTANPSAAVTAATNGTGYAIRAEGGKAQGRETRRRLRRAQVGCACGR